MAANLELASQALDVGIDSGIRRRRPSIKPTPQRRAGSAPGFADHARRGDEVL